MLMRAVVCSDAHGAVDGWLVLEVVSMAVLQNVAASDVAVIILQLGKVQPWLALHENFNLIQSSMAYCAWHTPMVAGINFDPCQG